MAGFGLAGRSIEEHFHHSFGVPRGGLADMAATLHARRGGPAGPVTLATRFVLEDVPYGFEFFVGMGRIARVPTPVIDACITLCSTLYARDFHAENELLAELSSGNTDAAQLLALVSDGYSLDA
jgi:opine dehydrogenase